MTLKLIQGGVREFKKHESARVYVLKYVYVLSVFVLIKTRPPLVFRTLGANCSVDVDECAKKPCGPKGSCADSTSKAGIKIGVYLGSC